MLNRCRLAEMVGKSRRVYVLNGRLAGLVGKMVVDHMCLMVGRMVVEHVCLMVGRMVVEHMCLMVGRMVVEHMY